MKTSYHPSLLFNAKAQGRKAKPATPNTAPLVSAAWRLGGLALNFIRAALLAAALALLPAAAHAQAIEAWVQRYNGPGDGDDRAFGLAVDTNANVHVTGPSTAADGYPDYATIKYSSAGVPLWTNYYNGLENGYDSAFVVAVDASGNVFVAGNSSGASGADFLTIKYSSAGTGLWTNRYSPGIAGEALAVDASGNVVVAGHGPSGCTVVKYSGGGALLWARDDSLGLPGTVWESKSIMAIDASGNVLLTGESEGDYMTIKYSSAGALLWTNRYNGPGNSLDRYTRVALDASGNVFVTGESANLSAYPYYYDIATIKYSSDGVPLWTNRYNGPANNDEGGLGLAVDASGNVVVTGWSYNGSDDDYVTIKYSSAGVPLWTNRYDGPGHSYDDPWAVAVDASGNVYVTGSSGGDYATIAYSSAGLPLWTNRYNGPANYDDQPHALALDPNANVYVTGRSANNNTWPYGYDYATVKYVTPPIITRQPLSRTNLAGSTASFTVEAVGGVPLSCQWRRDGTNLLDGGNLSGVTTTNLLIANVQLADAAGYTVVVTNAHGSVTSSVAQLTVTVPTSPGRFTRLAYSPDTGFSFIFRDATIGQPYRIQRSPSLAEGSWSNWQSFTYTEPILFTDLGATGVERRFYRAVSP